MVDGAAGTLTGAHAGNAAGMIPSARQWLSVADDLDLVEPALSLADLLAAVDPEWQGADVVRARLHLLADRPAEAAMLLGNGFDLTAPLSEESCTRAAVAAANGDDPAYRYLQGALREMSATGAPPWLVVYLTATAAELRRDYDISDPLWTRVVQEQHVVTPVTLPRYVAARVAGRSGSPSSRAALFRRMARIFDELVHPIEADPGPVIDAAVRLADRGDDVGAGLLLHAVRRRSGDLPEELQRAIEGLAGGRGPAARVRSRRARNGRGDRGVRRRIGPVDVSRSRAALPGLAGLAAAALLAAAVPLVRRPHPAGAVPHGTAAAIGLAGALPLAVAAYRAAARAGVAGPARNRKRGTVTACQCLTARAIAGPTALEYLRRHLDTLTESDIPMEQVRAGLGHDVAVARCRNTGIFWLGLDAAPGLPAYLFRGVAPVEPPVPAAGPGTYL